MHADRNRRYRARQRRMTDHGCAREHDAGAFPELEVDSPVTEPSPSGQPPQRRLCHRCGRPASKFLRLSALRPGRQGDNNSQMRHRVLQLGTPP
jgi:hypothetical protein